jgi:hypothetical protein
MLADRTLRLVGGVATGRVKAGRLEIYRDKRWRTVCAAGFGPADARVVCRQLGMRGFAMVVKPKVFGPGKGLVWRRQFACSGKEQRLEKCASRQLHPRTCPRHATDVGVLCATLPIVVHGR